ncbi:hypothetical protein D557_1612 [Bordetella holmesii 70147]|nr:hypothetical protein D557_1612 [Bordetella holmesii 70147]
MEAAALDIEGILTGMGLPRGGKCKFVYLSILEKKINFHI